MHIEEIKNTAPVEAFAAIRHLPKPFFFAGGFDPARRYSYAGAEPFITLETGIDGTLIFKGAKQELFAKDPFEMISGLLKRFKPTAKNPFPFSGGLSGYFAYGLKDAMFGRIPGQDATALPLCMAGVYDTVFVYDHYEKTGHLLCAGVDKNGKGRFTRIKDAIKNSKALPEKPLPPAGARFTSDVTKQEYVRMINAAHEYIAAGDIYQINLSQRLQIPWKGDAFALLRRLLKDRPAPFASFMDLGGFQIISNSPERLLKVDGSIAETSPIKGTRPRGNTPEEDARLIEELKNSPKENAEHVMIVDLERSDIGAVCEAASVEVAAFKAIETFPGLHHMTSIVRGRLRRGVDGLQCLKAIFPGGSVTGAPKIRAMEIIAELEKTPRGIYTGAMGWVDFRGDMDMAMPIRTAVYKNDTLHLSVGGGIVADSVPEDEYDETILKARDFLDAVAG